MVRVLRRFTNLRRRRYLSEGISFVNRVLTRLGRPLLTIDEYRATLAEVKYDKLLAERYEYHLAILRTTSPSKPIESWEHRFARGKGLLLGDVDTMYDLPRVLRPTLVVAA